MSDRKTICAFPVVQGYVCPHCDIICNANRCPYCLGESMGSLNSWLNRAEPFMLPDLCRAGKIIESGEGARRLETKEHPEA